MPTFPAEPGQGALSLVWADAEGRVGDEGIVPESGARAEEDGAPVVLVVPGEAAAIHWLDLDAGLTPAQATAAARLMLADMSAEPMAAVHVAIGRAEAGRTPVAIVRKALMADWLGQAASRGLRPLHAVPSPFLLPVPTQGVLRRNRGDVADFRGESLAFTLEPELAGALLGDAPVVTPEDAELEDGLFERAADPPLDLLQGEFASRRPWAFAEHPLRRIAVLALTLLFLTLALRIGTIMAYAFSADRLEAEAVSTEANAGAAGFSGAAATLFEALRSTPNAELADLDFTAEGGLTAELVLDSPATLAALRARLEAAGARVETGAVATERGRATARLRMRGP